MNWPPQRDSKADVPSESIKPNYLVDKLVGFSKRPVIILEYLQTRGAVPSTISPCNAPVYREN